ncbi:carboxylesterase/lipase family protein [soil metagenome]
MKNAAVAVVLAVSTLSSHAADPGPRTTIDSGAIEGTRGEGLSIYRGIPYAAAPVGALRWRPPQPAAAWSGTRRADAFGDDCVQIPFFNPPGPGYVRPQSENCLTLNVWAPATARKGAKPVPVMVWIYGGAFIMGSGAWPGYDGSDLARQGVIVVNFNYRLGRFGYFAHPALSRASNGEPVANYGLLDQMAALAWVKRNIAAFGGDASQVTVFGESAGGSSVNSLLTTPAAAGLFDRAISQSSGDRTYPTLASAEQAGVEWAAKLGLGADATPQALRELSADAVQNGAKEAPFAMSPIMDGRVLTTQPSEVFARGQQNKVPLMAGSNSYEQSLLKWLPGEIEKLYADLGARKETILAPYLKDQVDGSETAAAQAVWRDARMAAPARMMTAAMAKAGQPAWLYRFSYVSKQQRGKIPGVAHGAELPYVFGNVAGPALYGESADDRPMARTTSAYWVRFAKTGDPNGRGETSWPRYANTTDGSLEFTNDGPVTRNALDAARLDALEAIRIERLGLPQPR